MTGIARCLEQRPEPSLIDLARYQKISRVDTAVAVAVAVAVLVAVAVAVVVVVVTVVVVVRISFV